MEDTQNVEKKRLHGKASSILHRMDGKSTYMSEMGGDQAVAWESKCGNQQYSPGLSASPPHRQELVKKLPGHGLPAHSFSPRVGGFVSMSIFSSLSLALLALSSMNRHVSPHPLFFHLVYTNHFFRCQTARRHLCPCPVGLSNFPIEVLHSPRAARFPEVLSLVCA